MDNLLTLDEAAKLIPGANADTLKRLIRRGRLSATRPGKAFLTTAADVQEAIRLCRVVPKGRDCGSVLPAPPTAAPPLGSSSMELAKAALDSALAQAKAKNRKPSART